MSLTPLGPTLARPRCAGHAHRHHPSRRSVTHRPLGDQRLRTHGPRAQSTPACGKDRSTGSMTDNYTYQVISETRRLRVHVHFRVFFHAAFSLNYTPVSVFVTLRNMFRRLLST